MRKLLALLLVFSLAVTTANVAYAQEESDTTTTEETVDTSAAEEAAPAEEEVAPADNAALAADEPEQLSGFQILKKYFIDGDWKFMSFVLICLILGLAFCIERIITLNIATTNTDKLLARIDDELKSGNLEGAKEVCK